MKKLLIILGIIIIGALIVWFALGNKNNTADNTKTLISSVMFQCNDGKTIDASFYKGPEAPRPNPGEPPTSTGSVFLTLSDGRSMDLAQTISADGARYVNSNESFVFWNKGNGALVLENNEQKNYIGCILVAPDPGNLPNVYENRAQGFSLRYPNGYSVNKEYVYQALGPNKDISGVSFTIPQDMAEGTNLGADTYLSVEQIPQTQQCSANLFLANQNEQARTIDENDMTYSFASSTDAGTGNRYEEAVYALPGTNPCMAMRYFIHYSVFENYPAGTVTEFNKQAILDQFDAIRKTLTIAQ